MGCDYYIITYLYGLGKARNGDNIEIDVIYKREPRYFRYREDSDEENTESELNYTKNKTIFENCICFVNKDAEDKYKNFCKTNQEHLDYIIDLKRISYAVRRT
jgi:hypothetical protein